MINIKEVLHALARVFIPHRIHKNCWNDKSELDRPGSIFI